LYPHTQAKLDVGKAQDAPRLLFVDNLRILLIALVVMVHLSVTYGGVGGWYYKEDRPDTASFVVLTWHNGASQAFFMGFLFMISGYFTPGSYDRKGPRRFLKDRLLRLGIPLLCYDFIINPLLAYPLNKVHAWDFDGSYREFLATYYSSFHVGTGPLWFVEALLIFAVIYVLWRAVTAAKGRRSQSGRRLPSNKEIGFFALVLGAVTFAVRIWLPLGWAFEPLNLQLRHNLHPRVISRSVRVRWGGRRRYIAICGGRSLAMLCLFGLGAVCRRGDDRRPAGPVPRGTRSPG